MYVPREDSFLLAQDVEHTIRQIPSYQRKNFKILDMGTGSGVQADICTKAGIPRQNILAVDIDPQVIHSIKEKGFPAIHSNLFSNIKGMYNLIIFNPPYLPAHPNDKNLDITGGNRGYETILKFLQHAKNHLKKKGKILLLVSTLSKPKVIKRHASPYYSIQEISKKKLFFEELYVWKLEKIKKKR